MDEEKYDKEIYAEGRKSQIIREEPVGRMKRGRQSHGIVKCTPTGRIIIVRSTKRCFSFALEQAMTMNEEDTY